MRILGERELLDAARALLPGPHPCLVSGAVAQPLWLAGGSNQCREKFRKDGGEQEELHADLGLTRGGRAFLWTQRGREAKCQLPECPAHTVEPGAGVGAPSASLGVPCSATI